MLEAICMGEALIDFVALESGIKLSEAAEFKRAPGGAPANVAAALAKLGFDAAFLGQVGDDPFGRFLEQTLADAGVNTSLMAFSADTRTGLAFVSLTAEGVPDFIFFRNPSADITFRPEQLDLEVLSACQVFHFGSITLIEEPVRSTTLAALQRAVECGALISYDPNLRPALWSDLDRAREVMQSVLPDVDILKVSEEELHFLTGEKDLAQGAQLLLDQGPAVVLVTLGVEGSRAYALDDRQAYAPACKVAVVDTTGCGDAFVAGSLRFLMKERGCLDRDALFALRTADWEQCLLFANAVAGLTARERGAINALPRLADVRAFLQG